jgi:hypothetical protein
MALAGFTSAGAMAASITPSTVDRTITVGETITINKTITLDARAVGVVDIFFLADNTGSMGGTITNVRNSATALMTSLASTFSSAQFGVGRYFGDPIEPDTYASAYDRLQGITSSIGDAQTAMNTGWIASGGGDGPEANFYALHQVATSGANVPGTPLTPAAEGGLQGTGENTGWRPGASKVIVWFGDVQSHNETITEAQTIAALQANNVIVIGMNSSIDNFGIDGSFNSANGNDTNQCDDITAATGGTCFHNFNSVPPGDVADTIADAIGSATTELDLVFGHSLLGGGLDIGFTCTDALGCDDVPGGASRTFDLTIRGLAPGTYNFNVFAAGVDAIETDTITVLPRDGTVPEPGVLALLGLGLAGLAIGRRRRQ